MNILLYIFAGNGDLINTTGVIKQLKSQYPNLTIDFLVKGSQAYLLKNNPYIRQVLSLEDYGLVFTGKDPRSLDRNVLNKFKDYNKCINMWSKKHHEDFPISKTIILKEHGFNLKFNREDINGILYPDEEDRNIVFDFINENLGFWQEKEVVLIEDDSINGRTFNFKDQLAQINHQKNIAAKLIEKGYAVISNSIPNTIHCNNLSLVQIKLLFELVGDIFLGLSSGMTTVFFTEGNYDNKMFIIAGRKEWNYCKHIKSMKKHAFIKNYTWETLNADLRIFNRPIERSKS
jgi:hypothetical protein